MPEQPYNDSIADPQGTLVDPIAPEKFDVERYAEYEASLLEKNREFWQSTTGVAVHRRFRVPEVFSYACRDMKLSLALQLGALQESMKYKMDIANYLEPWYGIGVVASAFGVEYEWYPGNAPAIKAPFQTVDEALNREIRPIERTPIGKQVLEMIEYFLDKTRGKIPMSLTDTQASLNVASFIVETKSFLMSFFNNLDGLKKLLALITDLTIDFTKRQMELIGDLLVLPGHGFTSSRFFSGLGVSSDFAVMISPDQYIEFEQENMEKLGNNFGGVAFHSCGNWANKTQAIRRIKNLVMVDGAFSTETDPDPNPIDPFVDAFASTGISVNARIVGDKDVVISKAKQLFKPGMKLIVVTYCKTPEEQQTAYDEIHGFFNEAKM